MLIQIKPYYYDKKLNKYIKYTYSIWINPDFITKIREESMLKDLFTLEMTGDTHQDWLRIDLGDFDNICLLSNEKG